MKKTLEMLAKYNIEKNQYRISSHKKIADILFFCESKEIKILFPAIIKKGKSQNSYLRYSCECGNEAESTTTNFMKKTVFACKKCNAKLINKIFKPIKTSEIQKDIENKGYTVISHNHENNLESSIWTLKCSNGHVFNKNGNKLKTIQSCPDCFVDSYEEFIFRKLIECHYGEKFPKSHPEWLVNAHTNHILELDMYSKSLGLAFEYNGIQHYSPIYGEERYKISLRNDNEKKKRCIENNVKLISIKYLTTKTTNKSLFVYNLAEELKEHNIFIKDETIQEILLEEYQVTNKTDKIINDLHKTLKKQNREWISGVYLNSKSKIKIKCLKCNAEKETSIHTLVGLKNKKITKCSSCTDRFANKKKLAIEKHIIISKKICKNMNFIFEELQYNTYGHVSGFWYTESSKKILFGCKKYRKAISNYNL